MTARRQRPRGIAAITFAFLSIGIVPIVGLSIDVGLLYAVKSKLSAAVDAGALAGARSLSQGANTSAQTASAQATAANYISANFPSAYYFTSNLTIPASTVDTSQANVRTITTTATVQAPLYFMHWFTDNLITVSASATAIRRDVNVVMVVDRSGSLEASGSCGALRSAATNFQNKFAEGRDNLGLVTFASSAFVDFPLGNTFKSAAPSVATLLNGLVCNGATSSAMGLWLGYQQLATLNQPNSLNVILFFTDGQPTGVTANYTILAGSSCAVKTPKLGVYNGSTTCCSVGGLLRSSVQAQPMASDHVEVANSSGCAYDSNWFPSDTNAGSMWNGYQDVSFIPATDVYGNGTETGYQAVPLHRNGGIDPSDWTSVTAAAVNSADNAGLRIRHGLVASAVLPGIPNVVVFSLGLGNAAIPASGDLLQRISNDTAASNFDSTYPSGYYVSAPTSADLADAFSKIASEILRLAK